MHRSRARRGRSANSSSARAGPVHGRRQRDDGGADIQPRQRRRREGIGYSRRSGPGFVRRSKTGWKKLRKPVRDETPRFCEQCNRHFYDDNAYVSHMRSRRHLNKWCEVLGQEALENEMEDSADSESDIGYEEEEVGLSLEEKVQLFRQEYSGGRQLPPEFVKWCEKSLGAPGISPDRKLAIFNEIASEYAVAKQQGNLLSVTWSARPPATGALYMPNQPEKILRQPTFGPNFGKEKPPIGGGQPQFTMGEGSATTFPEGGRGDWELSRVIEQSRPRNMPQKPYTRSITDRERRALEKSSAFRAPPPPPSGLVEYTHTGFRPSSRAARRMYEICSRNKSHVLRLLYERDFAPEEEEDTPPVGTANFELIADSFDYERKRTMDLVRPLEILMRALSRAKKYWRGGRYDYTKFKRQLDAILADMDAQQIKSVELIEVYEAYAEAALTVYNFKDAGKALDALMDLYRSSTQYDRRCDRFIAFWVFYKMRTAKSKHELHLLLNWCPLTFIGKCTKFALEVLNTVYNSNYERFFNDNENMYELFERPLAQLLVSSLDPFYTMMRSRAVERLAVCYRFPNKLSLETVSVKIGFRYHQKAGVLISQVDQTAKLLKEMKVELKPEYSESMKMLAFDCRAVFEKLDDKELLLPSGEVVERKVYD